MLVCDIECIPKRPVYLMNNTSHSSDFDKIYFQKNPRRLGAKPNVETLGLFKL